MKIAKQKHTGNYSGFIKLQSKTTIQLIVIIEYYDQFRLLSRAPNTKRGQSPFNKNIMG